MSDEWGITVHYDPGYDPPVRTHKALNFGEVISYLTSIRATEPSIRSVELVHEMNPDRVGRTPTRDKT